MSLFSKKEFNSLSHIEKGTILWLIFQRKGNNLWDIFKKGSILLIHIQLYESFFLQKKGSILWIILKKKGSILRVIFQKVQFCESYFKGFNSWSHIMQKGSIHTLSHISICSKKKVNSLSHIFSRVQFLWVMLKRRVQFCESYLKMVQFLESYFRKVQFFESSKKGWILRVIFQKVQFFESL